MPNFITELEVEKALDYLRDDAVKTAQAKANRVYVEEYRKVLKAQIMKEHGELSTNAQEREAYADPRYEKHLQAIREAVEIHEKHLFLREGARLKLETFQTLSANYRSMKI